MRNFAPLELPTSRLIIIITRSEFVIDQFLLAWKQKQKIVFENFNSKRIETGVPVGRLFIIELEKTDSIIQFSTRGLSIEFRCSKRWIAHSTKILSQQSLSLLLDHSVVMTFLLRYFNHAVQLTRLLRDSGNARILSEIMRL